MLIALCLTVWSNVFKTTEFKHQNDNNVNVFLERQDILGYLLHTVYDGSIRDSRLSHQTFMICKEIEIRPETKCMYAITSFACAHVLHSAFPIHFTNHILNFPDRNLSVKKECHTNVYTKDYQRESGYNNIQTGLSCKFAMLSWQCHFTVNIIINFNLRCAVLSRCFSIFCFVDFLSILYFMYL